MVAMLPGYQFAGALQAEPGGGNPRVFVIEVAIFPELGVHIVQVIFDCFKVDEQGPRYSSVGITFRYQG